MMIQQECTETVADINNTNRPATLSCDEQIQFLTEKQSPSRISQAANAADQ